MRVLHKDKTDHQPQAFWLANLGKASSYNRWVFDNFAPYLGDNILEVGCGSGTFTPLLAMHARHVLAFDLEPQFANISQQVTAALGNVEVRVGDVLTETFPVQFDTVVMLDVLEHIENDGNALCKLQKNLSTGGRIILKVPAFEFLRGAMDDGVGHFRRYSKTSLRKILLESGFDEPRQWYFNAPAMLGWWLNGKLLGRTTPPEGQLSLFERLMPIIRIVDRAARPFAGLSIFAVARKSAD